MPACGGHLTECLDIIASLWFGKKVMSWWLDKFPHAVATDYSNSILAYYLGEYFKVLNLHVVFINRTSLCCKILQ